ncbi:MAG: N-acetylglucosamine-6-phosphate deacetylase [Halioglobus sp.]|nr:N-acetylglucosamine-6-phosphate deacetylase [Halioglobus sp.]
MSQLIVNGAVFDGETLRRDSVVLISGGRIERVAHASELSACEGEVHDLHGGLLVPGFIDLQVNGGGGVLFNAAPSVDSLRAISAAHRRYGTTAFLPTLISDDFDVVRRAINAVGDALQEGVPGVLGIHLEGPFLNPERSGAHDPTKLCSLDARGIALISSLKMGKTVVTLAPELTTSAAIRQLVKLGVIVCAGHSMADYNQTREALAAGLSGFTHLYNAMTPLQSREPGMVGAALEDDVSWFGIIADGHHSHPAAFRAAVAAKRTGGAILVTDAMPTVGSTELSFALNGETLVAHNGKIINAEGRLAGADLDMLTAVNNAAAFARIDWFEAVRMASLYPARALGLAGEIGAIAPGYRANVVAFDAQRQLRATWVDGVKMVVAPTQSH